MEYIFIKKKKMLWIATEDVDIIRFIYKTLIFAELLKKFVLAFLLFLCQISLD